MDSRTFLFVSAEAALITDLAWQVHREGHDVKYYIQRYKDGRNRFTGTPARWRTADPVMTYDRPYITEGVTESV